MFNDNLTEYCTSMQNILFRHISILHHIMKFIDKLYILIIQREQNRSFPTKKKNIDYHRDFCNKVCLII